MKLKGSKIPGEGNVLCVADRLLGENQYEVAQPCLLERGDESRGVCLAEVDSMHRGAKCSLLRFDR